MAMNLLLDTHVLLWFISGDPRLSAAAQEAIRDPGNDVFLSVVSVWEAIVKHSLGKLPLPQSPEVYLPLGVAIFCGERGSRIRNRVARIAVNSPLQPCFTGCPTPVGQIIPHKKWPHPGPSHLMFGAR